MLSDVVSPSSYLTFNVTIAQIIGLTNAVYCAELLDIYAKAKRKKKLDDNQFFTIDRYYVKAKTSITIDEQYVCDVSLNKIGVITTSTESPDKIKFDVEMFMQIIAEEDSKELSKISKKVKLPINVVESKKLKRESIKLALIKVISKDNVKIYEALVDWLTSIFDEDKVSIKKCTVEDFQRVLFEYAGTDVEKALKIIAIAKNQSWINCVSAIESYEAEQRLLNNAKAVRTTKLKIASSDNLSDKRY